MAARIPDALPDAEVSGYRPSTRTVAPTDFGLGELAQGVNAAAQVNDQADFKAAAPLAQKLRGENQAGFETDAAAYTGDNPGFAADQISKAQSRAATVLADPTLAPGVRRHLGELAIEETARAGAEANIHEAKVRAEPIVAMRQAQDASQLNGGLTTFHTTFEPARQKLSDSYDGSTPGYTADVTQAFEDAATAAITATPERLQGALQARLAVERTSEIATASKVEQAGADHYVLKAGQDQAGAVINTISSNPLAYDSAVRTLLPAIADTMPAGLRKDLLHELKGQAAVARVKGLVLQDHLDQAASELKAGRYDEVLNPKVKEELMAHVEAAQRYKGPKSIDQAVAAIGIEQAMSADLYARTTRGQGTGGVNLDQAAALLSPERVAQYLVQGKQADQAFAVTGAVRDLPTAGLHAVLAQAAPEPADPDYPAKVVAWQTGQQAAQSELKARDNAGAWAYTVGSAPLNSRGGGKSVAGAGVAQDRGALLQQTWNDYLGATPGASRFEQGGHVAGRALGVQAAAGIPPSSWQIIPQTEAARLASTVVNAAPEGKLAALSSLAGLIHDLPVAFKMPDGSWAQPQQLITKQLLAAHVSPAEVAAMVDFGSDPAKMGRYVAALNDPTLKAALPSGQQANLKAQVVGAIKPFLDSVAPLPGCQDLAQARIDRTLLIARGLIAHQGMNPGTAAQTAAMDMTTPYRFTDTWRMPAALADARVHLGMSNPSGVQAARQGAASMLYQLTANKGAALMAVGGPGGPGDQRAQAADKIAHFGRWVTAPDDSGLVLMTPHPDGGFDQVQDRYGRPVRASWAELQAQALAPGGPVKAPPPSFLSPPPTALRAPDGAPLPAVTKATAFAALSWAVTGQESGGHNGLVSPKGALGPMQVMPDTVKTYAPRLNLPVDFDRAQNDVKYNRAIGEAALQDHLQHFGTGAGIGLALAAFNAGRGHLDGYTDPASHTWQPGWLQTIGDPRTGKITLNDFVARIPYPETRAYVQAVLPSALRRLQAQH